MISAKNVTSYSKRFFFAFLKVFKLLGMCAKSINRSFLSRKKYDWDNITPTPGKRLRGQDTLVRIRLTELTEPFDTLNYRPFFKYCILQTYFYTHFSCLYLCGTKSFVLKAELYFTFFLFSLGWHSVLQY